MIADTHKNRQGQNGEKRGFVREHIRNHKQEEKRKAQEYETLDFKERQQQRGAQHKMPHRCRGTENANSSHKHEKNGYTSSFFVVVSGKVVNRRKTKRRVESERKKSCGKAHDKRERGSRGGEHHRLHWRHCELLSAQQLPVAATTAASLKPPITHYQMWASMLFSLAAQQNYAAR
jgi:hypothetical protein